MNEELGRQRGREGKKVCGGECESVSHVLWECPAYHSIRAEFLLQLWASLGDSYARFEAMSSFKKASFVLGNELWEEHFESLWGLVKVDVWEERKSRFFGDIACIEQPRPQSPTGDLGDIAGVKMWNGKGVCQGGKPGTGKLIMYVCMAPPTLVGAWSMALVLRQRIECYSLVCEDHSLHLFRVTI